MHLSIRGRHVPISPALREYCSERVERALHSYRQHVEWAEVVLVDLNGPRGGIAQACKLSVLLDGGTRLMVQSLGSDFYAASGEAAGRVGRLVSRELGRTRTRARRGGALRASA